MIKDVSLRKLLMLTLINLKPERRMLLGIVLGTCRLYERSWL
jgi:hypothetical protein